MLFSRDSIVEEANITMTSLLRGQIMFFLVELAFIPLFMVKQQFKKKTIRLTKKKGFFAPKSKLNAQSEKNYIGQKLKNELMEIILLSAQIIAQNISF